MTALLAAALAGALAALTIDRAIGTWRRGNEWRAMGKRRRARAEATSAFECLAGNGAGEPIHGDTCMVCKTRRRLVANEKARRAN